MRMKTAIAVVTAAAIVGGVQAQPEAGTARYDLVPYRTCVAGNWGTPSVQWRVQFGFFYRDEFGLRYVDQLAKKRVVAVPMIAAWEPVKEPMAVVSSRAYANHRAAAAAAAAYRKRGVRAFPRKYTVYRR